MRLFAGLVLLAVVPLLCRAFYLPGVAPQDYGEGEPVKLKVNKIDSVKTQLPYTYYSLGFCVPNKLEEDNENLGEILSGDVIESSVYKIKMRWDEVCQFACPPKQYTESELKDFASRIEDEYRVNMIVDNLPAATKYFTASEPDEKGNVEYVPHYEKGFALGFLGSAQDPRTVKGVKYINNHLRLILQYHKPASASDPNNPGYRVVGFEVEPFSVKHVLDGSFDPNSRQNKLKTCGVHMPVTHNAVPQPVSTASGAPLTGNDASIVWTYDVKWEASDIKWASRWDLYLKMTDSQVHWFSIINSMMIVLFLSGMIAMIMMRTLHRDIMRYNQLETSEEAQQEETGWKLIYGEVFRPPHYGGLFAVLLGSGVQVFAMTLLTLVFALLGFLSPANRGGLMTALLLLFVFMGVFAGYYSTRIYKMFKLTEWKKNTFWTAVSFPGVCFIVFFILNLFVWGKKSSGAVPFGTLVALLVLWFGISVPLVYIGSYFAFKKPVDPPPCTVNNIPRMTPEQAWYMQPQFALLIGGILPFGAVFIEIFFIMSSVWLHQFYYVFGFLFLVFIILIITCAEITIVMCYFQLCAEDYHWWWRSFLTPASSALYLFLYSVLYFFTKLEITAFVPGLLFFGYMFLVSIAFFLLTGTIGYFACYQFVHAIYSSIKVD